MTPEDVAIMKRGEAGTKVRVLDLGTPASGTYFPWWESSGYLEKLKKQGAVIYKGLDGEKAYKYSFSFNRGVNCILKFSSGAVAHVTNAKIIPWKEGDTEHDIHTDRCH